MNTAESCKFHDSKEISQFEQNISVQLICNTGAHLVIVMSFHTLRIPFEIKRIYFPLETKSKEGQKLGVQRVKL